MRFNPYLINTGSKDDGGFLVAAAPRIHDMHLNDVLINSGFTVRFSDYLCIMISEQLGIETRNLKPSDFKNVDLDLLCTRGSPAFQLLVTEHMNELRRLQNLIKTLV
jgi:hypothetical protein